MSSAMLMERSMMAAGMGAPGHLNATSPMGTQAPNFCVVPRCNMRFEKCEGGFKLWCACEDKLAASTLQNLCRMLADQTCCCCCTFNGINVCQCNLACCHCKCENTKDGVCITCHTGDKECCQMIQACCDCLSACCQSGCCCYVCFGNTPVCCGC